MTITGFEDVEEMLNKLANPYEMAEKGIARVLLIKRYHILRLET